VQKNAKEAQILAPCKLKKKKTSLVSFPLSDYLQKRDGQEEEET